MLYRIPQLVFIFFAAAHGVPTAAKSPRVLHPSPTPPTCEEECEGKTKALMPAVQTAADWFDHKLEAKYGTIGAVDLVGKLCGNNTSSSPMDSTQLFFHAKTMHRTTMCDRDCSLLQWTAWSQCTAKGRVLLFPCSTILVNPKFFLYGW